MIICVESGMSIEHSRRKVSQEIGTESMELAEEMSLLAAEMSYLENRRIAFDNLQPHRYRFDQAALTRC